MSAHVTPCARPENDPEDWFIERDGKQYVDDNLRVVEGAMDETIRANLKRRRHAKDACHTECYFRTQCLGLALEEGHTSGTWGGYYPEELREIRRVRDERAKRHSS